MRKNDSVDFHLTQALTGHGCFNQYLHRVGKLEHPGCLSCGGIADNVEHTLFVCDRWSGKRRDLEFSLGEELEPESIVRLMLRNSASWKAVQHFVSAVLFKKEEEE